ncbi:DUF4132 domain-containing protein [Promicromonospora sp. NPDC057138]|uniref:DUF4132 domain-containing protein n=1 Tax=Promicromonospora sp. NPDC057138 TaxID=3346031 RepID=UPI00362A561A
MTQDVQDVGQDAGTVDDEALARAYRDALAPLTLIGQDMFEQAVGYVRDGTPSWVPTKVEAADTHDVDVLMNSWVSWLYESRKLLAERMAAAHPGWEAPVGVAARKTVHATAPVAAIVRLGRLLDVVVGNKPGPEGVPDWLSVLMLDASDARATSGRWTPRFAMDVAREGGVPDGEVVPVVLTILLEHALGVTDVRSETTLSETLVAHADALPQVVAGLTDRGKKTFLQCARHGLVRHAELVGMLVVDPEQDVRAAAGKALAGLADADEVRLLAPHLTTAPLDRASEVLARLCVLPGGQDAIREALAELSAGVGAGAGDDRDPAARTKAMRQALERAEVLLAQEVVIEVPAFQPAPEFELGDDFVAGARALVDRQREQAAAKVQRLTANDDYEPWMVERAKGDLTGLSSITDSELRAVVRLINGDRGVEVDGRDGLLPKGVVSWCRQNVESLPTTALVHQARLHLALYGSGYGLVSHLAEWLEAAHGVDDLRVLEQVLVQCGVDASEQAIDEFVFQYQYGEVAWPSAAAVWPYYAGHVHLLVPRLAPPDTFTHRTDRLYRALAILRAFPVAPTAALPRLGELALTGGKVERNMAQRALESHPGARRLAEQGLGENRAEVRVSAAAWLARIGDPAATPALRAALKKERGEAARAALLSALEALGDDLSAQLTPEMLLAEAAKGLKRPVPAALDWFLLEQLPQARWADGAGDPDAVGQREVPPEVLRWWVVLAHKLKDPSGEGLLARYVSLLDPASRAELGSFVLSAWVAQDTRHPAPEESRAHAEANAQLEYDRFHRDPVWYARAAPERLAMSVEDHHSFLYREHQAQYLGSAAKDKGLLALTVGMPGGDLAAVARHYFTAHKGRRAQVESLVRALAANGERAAVQVLLSVALRFKPAAVQQIAAGLVQELADRRGWTADQLADRTVPTAGFDGDGVLRLDLGSPGGGVSDSVSDDPESDDRVFTGRVTEKFTLELRDPAGKVVKALPAQRERDDDEAYAEAKKQLAASRKELKAVIALQTQRLAEAMASGRRWAVEGWRELVLGHPLLSRLAARLVWVATLPDGSRVAFRPGDSGALIGVDDEDVALPDWAEVAVAHAVLLPDAAAWRAHLADYSVSGLFDQGLASDVVVPEVEPGATEIADHEGWLSDTFAIRGRATKLGYKRDVDDLWIRSYVKEYASLGVIVEIGFTGSALPEKKEPAAVTELLFRHAGRPGSVPVADLPTTLVAVSYQEYVTVAEGGAFDPDWERKSY